MKNLAFLFAIAMLFLVAACGSDSSSNTDTAGSASEPAMPSVGGTENITPTVAPSAPAVSAPAPAAAGAAAGAGGAQHYVCPKGCKGGGGPAQGNCPVCGTAMAHNQAFHAQDTKNATAPSPTQMPAPAATTPEPAQNAAGVWHYTCGKGCAGGAGAAGNCAKCGGPLAHNSAYHNK